MVAGLVALAGAGRLWAQVPAAAAGTPPPQPDQATVFRARTSLVLVPALVTTSKGALVYTLGAKDFSITDDGVEQAVSLEEETGGEPLALVVAIQVGGEGGRRLDEYRHLDALIEAVVGNVKRRVAVVAFDSVADTVVDFTPDLAKAEEAIHDLDVGDHGAAILDGLTYSVGLLRKQPLGYRRAILLISETVDHGSKVKIEEALRAVSDTNTAIYSLGFSSTRSDMGHEAGDMFYGPPGPAGGCMARDPDRDPEARQQSRAAQAFDCLSLLAPPLRLAKMAALAGMNALRKNVPETVARLSGGEYYKFSDARSLEKGLLTISNRLPNRYVLSFHPADPHPGFHAVAVTLKEYPDLVVRGRTGYWAEAQ